MLVQRRKMRRSMPIFPKEFVEIMKDLDQTVEVDLQLGTSVEEIISDQKPVIDNLLQGFKAKLSMNYIKNLKKILKESDNAKVTELMNMFGFGFKIGVKSNLEFEFSEAEEIKEHPMVGQFADKTFGGFLEMIAQDRTYLEGSFEPMTLDAEKQAKVDALMAEEDKAKLALTFYNLMGDIGTLIRSIGKGNQPIQQTIFVEDCFVLHAQETLPGVGTIAGMVYRELAKDAFEGIGGELERI